jgi:hypothetical protein
MRDGGRYAAGVAVEVGVGGTLTPGQGNRKRSALQVDLAGADDVVPHGGRFDLRITVRDLVPVSLSPAFVPEARIAA